LPDAILILAAGGYGDVHPMIGPALALRARGHYVRFACSSKYESRVKADGIEFVEFSAAPWKTAAAASNRSWLAQHLSRNDARKRAYTERMEPHYRLVAQEPRPAVVVAGVNAFGARIAQEKLGIKLVNVNLQPSAFRSAYDAPGLPLPAFAGRRMRGAMWRMMEVYLGATIAPDLNRFRKSLGLSTVVRPFHRWMYSTDAVIGLFPDWFGAPQPDWPPNAYTSDFPLFDDTGAGLPAEVETFLGTGDPPIVFTRGSQSSGERAFFQTCVDTCVKLRRRGLLLASQPGAVPDDLPDSIRHFDFVPLSRILHRAAAIVHHGGVGTIALSFAAGVPQLAVPLFDDQPDNAARVERLGAGFVLPAPNFRAETLTAKLTALLASREIAATCRKIAERMRTPDRFARACEIIERYLPG
jgi:UDP:flavonoid glycosyltransferase YjiC (YdhE family)